MILPALKPSTFAEFELRRLLCCITSMLYIQTKQDDSYILRVTDSGSEQSAAHANWLRSEFLHRCILDTTTPPLYRRRAGFLAAENPHRTVAGTRAFSMTQEKILIEPRSRSRDAPPPDIRMLLVRDHPSRKDATETRPVACSPGQNAQFERCGDERMSGRSVDEFEMICRSADCAWISPPCLG